MKSSIILSLGFLSGLSTAVPQPIPADTTSASTSTLPSGNVNFATFKIPDCAAGGISHIESHEQVPNGHCGSFDWLRSISYKADFPHTYCDVKFFSNDACGADKEIPAPGNYSTVLIDNYYPGCWDDLTVRGGGVTVEEGWVVVPLVNMTISCT